MRDLRLRAPAAHRSAAAGSAPRRRSARPRACDASRAPSGSAFTAMIARSSSTPHIVCWKNSRVPTASTTSASPHNSRPSGSVTASGLRLSSTPWPRRKPHSTGACSISASCGHLAARHPARRRRPRSSDSSPRRAAWRHRAAHPRRSPAARPAADRCGVTSPGLPHTLIGHSSAAGPGRPVAIARNASATMRGAVSGAADQRRVVDQARNDAGLIVDLVQVPELAADIGVGNLPDQRQHRRVHRIGGQQRGATR